MTHTPAYLSPAPAGPLAEKLHDPYGLGCQVVNADQQGHYRQCRHTAIHAVSLYPALGLAQFSNPDGLVLPVVIRDHQRHSFEREMSRAYARHLGYLRGRGRFMLRLKDIGMGRFGIFCPHLGRMVEGDWGAFVTYYLTPVIPAIRFLQDGQCPHTPPAYEGEWEALCVERDEVRVWLGGETPQAPSAVVTLAQPMPSETPPHWKEAGHAKEPSTLGKRA